jgi:hypothetical protein
MAKPTSRQRRIEGRVLHEFKHGELRSGPGGKGGKVKSRRQAIAIALSEAGASKYQSRSENKQRLRKTRRKERRGETGQQEREGRSHLGARGKRESSRAMGRQGCAAKNAARRESSGDARAAQRADQGGTLPACQKARRRGPLEDDQAATGERGELRRADFMQGAKERSDVPSGACAGEHSGT